MKEIRAVGDKNTKQTIGMTGEDIAVYRVTIMILVNVISVYALWFVQQNGSRQFAFVQNVVPVLIWVFAALTLLAFGAIMFFGLRDKESPFKVVSLEYIFGVSLVAFLVSLLYRQMNPTHLILATILVSIPYYIYYFFKRTFFLYSVYSVFAIILSRCFLVTQFARLGSFGPFLEILSVILGILVPLAVIISVLASAKKDGVLVLLGRPVKLYNGRRDYIAFTLLSAVLLVEAVLSLVLPAAFPFFFYPLAAMFLLFAIIYAIKMI
ncbi:MAG: hypothetical protein J6D21_03505 [Clostridia bacterium]|nr:hypothetical protein [Clostridia bacterium]